MTADAVIRLLAEKHADDVFVAECKDGPTQSVREHLKMDAWVMPRSWASPACTGYEVKVARSDFLRDEKWHKYLPLCHRFYFVCPTDLIQPEEVPESAGLLWVSKTGTKLYTKRKAPHRDVDIPESLFRYVLMCRAKIARRIEEGTRDDRIAAWKDWLSKKDDCRSVSLQIKGVIREKMIELQDANKKLAKENEEYADVVDVMKRLGVERSRYAKFEIERKVKQTDAADPRLVTLGQELEATQRSLRSAMQFVEEIKRGTHT